MSINYKIFKTLCLCLVLITASGLLKADPGKQYQKRQKKNINRYAQRYLDVTAGYGVWTRTFQAGMSSNAQPLDLSITYGATHRPYAIQVGTTLMTSFSQDIFLFKPRFAYAGVRLSLLDLMGQKSRWDPFVFGGVAGWQAVLTDGVYDGIVNYQEKREKAQGIGGVVSGGASYQIKPKWSVGAQVKYYHGTPGEYLAGGFEPQKINPSYLAAMIQVSYRISLGQKGATCPSYF